MPPPHPLSPLLTRTRTRAPHKTARVQLYDALLQNAGSIVQPLAARDIAPRVAQLAARSEWPDVREAAAAAAALQARG